MTQREEFEAWAKSKHLDVDYKEKDAWGRELYTPHIQSMWTGWQAAQAAQPAHAHTIDTSPERVEKQAADVQVLEGWKLVPVEPTEAMVEAAGLDCVMGKSTWAVTAALWSAMLSAAPSTKEGN